MAMTNRIRYLLPNTKEYKRVIQIDMLYNKEFRGGELSRKFLRSLEWRFIKAYRKYQVNIDTIWKELYQIQLNRIENKTGISTEGNPTIGEGLIIGHKGTVVINGQVQFGSQLFITHGVTVGRDIRGKRAGVPSFGNRVCIRANSTVVGNIRIGDDVLIAPNTFVNFDVPNHSIVIGNPASIIHRDNATEGHIPIINQ